MSGNYTGILCQKYFLPPSILCYPGYGFQPNASAVSWANTREIFGGIGWSSENFDIMYPAQDSGYRPLSTKNNTKECIPYLSGVVKHINSGSYVDYYGGIQDFYVEDRIRENSFGLFEDIRVVSNSFLESEERKGFTIFDGEETYIDLGMSVNDYLSRNKGYFYAKDGVDTNSYEYYFVDTSEKGLMDLSWNLKSVNFSLALQFEGEFSECLTSVNYGSIVNRITGSLSGLLMRGQHRFLTHDSVGSTGNDAIFGSNRNYEGVLNMNFSPEKIVFDQDKESWYYGKGTCVRTSGVYTTPIEFSGSLVVKAPATSTVFDNTTIHTAVGGTMVHTSMIFNPFIPAYPEWRTADPPSFAMADSVMLQFLEKAKNSDFLTTTSAPPAFNTLLSYKHGSVRADCYDGIPRYIGLGGQQYRSSVTYSDEAIKESTKNFICFKVLGDVYSNNKRGDSVNLELKEKDFSYTSIPGDPYYNRYGAFCALHHYSFSTTPVYVEDIEAVGVEGVGMVKKRRLVFSTKRINKYFCKKIGKLTLKNIDGKTIEVPIWFSNKVFFINGGPNRCFDEIPSPYASTKFFSEYSFNVGGRQVSCSEAVSSNLSELAGMPWQKELENDDGSNDSSSLAFKGLMALKIFNPTFDFSNLRKTRADFNLFVDKDENYLV